MGFFSIVVDMLLGFWRGIYANISFIADSLSIVAFFITLWMASAVFQLQQKFSFKGRMPQFIKDVSRYSSGISSYLDAGSLDSGAVMEVLIKCHSLTISLKKVAPKDLSPTIKSVNKLLRSCIRRKKSDDREFVRNIYYGLMRLVSDLDNYKKTRNGGLINDARGKK